MLPNFIGIGAPKSATTWLFRCLREHPEVYLAPCKETNFFDYDTIEGRIDEYSVHFRSARREVAIGEISNRYFASDRAPQRIQRLLPGARLFVSLRNPLEQVWSHYWHLKRQNFHQWERSRIPKSFDQAIEQQGKILLDSSYYYQHLRKWFEHFPRDQILIILFDDICSDPGAILAKLYAFLGVDARFQPSFRDLDGVSTRRGVSPQSDTLGLAHSLLYDVLNRHLYQRLKKNLGVKSAIRIKEALRVRQLMEKTFMQAGYPSLPPETRDYLADLFRADIEKLSDLLERDLSCWLGKKRQHCEVSALS